MLAAAQARLTMGVWLLFDGFGVAVGAFQLERFLITYILFSICLNPNAIQLMFYSGLFVGV